MRDVLLAVLLAFQAGGADASNSSGAWGTFLWMGVIAVVLICLGLLAMLALGAGTKRRT